MKKQTNKQHVLRAFMDQKTLMEVTLNLPGVMLQWIRVRARGSLGLG